MSLQIAGGLVLFNPYVNGAYQGELEFASSQGFTANRSPTTISTYNNDNTGIGLQEDETEVKVDWAATTRLRRITLEVLALIFGADAVTARTQSAGSLSESIVGVRQGRWYQMGVGAGFPTGARKLSAPAVTVSAAAKTGYTMDLDRCRIRITEGGDIITGDTVDVAGTLAAATWDAVISAGAAAVGEMRIIGAATKGTPRDYYFPKVSLSVDGDFALKGDPENPGYQEAPFSIKILEDIDRGLSSIYVDGQAV